MSKRTTSPFLAIALISVGLIFVVLGITVFKETHIARYVCIASGVIILLIAFSLSVSQFLQRKKSG